MNVLVTGGATGLGKAIARQFRDDCDAHVVITGRTESTLRTAAEELDVEFAVCDHSDPAQISDLGEKLPADLDVIVNNAGGIVGFGEEDPVGLEAVRKEWLENYTANVLTAVLTVTELGPRVTNGGTIINIGSIAAESGAGSYGSAKAAIGSWTVGLAKSLGRRGITVNAISPGFIGQTNFFRGKLSAERERSLVSATQNNRRGEPDDIAALSVFLASPGGAHVTGQTLHVNGGTFTTR